MPKIAVNVKKDKLAHNISDDLKVDLRNGPNQEKKQKQPIKRRLFLVIFLVVLVVFFGLSCLFLILGGLPFSKIIPQNKVTFSLIDQKAFYQQISPFYSFLEKEGIYQKIGISKMAGYLEEADLNFEEDIAPLFKNDVAFVTLPANQDSDLPFVLLFEKKVSLDKINHILNKLEPNLKEDYNISFQSYRQIEIVLLKPIVASSANIFSYAKINNYLAVGNSPQVIKNIVDRICQ